MTAAQQQSLASQPPTIICRFGSEYVQEIVTRTMEVFNLLRTMTHQTSVINANPALAEEKRNKLRDLTKYIEMYFRRLRTFYDK